MSITTLNAELEKEREKYLKDIQKQIQIPGFRPGKAPISIVKKKYNGTAFYEGFEKLLKDKTNEILNNQPQRPLYYVYNFENNSKITDDGTDKKISIEFLLEPKVDINIQEKNIELVKYGFTETQRILFSDIIVLFNFLNPNSVEKLENYSDWFIISSELENPELAKDEDETKRKKSKLPFVVHSYQFQSYELSKLIPSSIEKNQVYSINAKEWLDILEKNFPNQKLALKEFLSNSNSTIQIKINDIEHYPDFAQYLNTDRIKQVFALEENTDINLDLVYNKLAEIIDYVADYYSGYDNIKIGNEFMKQILKVDVPDEFIHKLYSNYIKDEDQKYLTFEIFKSEIIREIEIEVKKNLLPNTFNPSTDYEEFITNVAKTYLVETLITQVHLYDLNSIKDFINFNLQNADEKRRKEILENYQHKASLYSFTKSLSQDVKTSYKLENINTIHFSNFFEIKEELFV
jgi:trigger factor